MKQKTVFACQECGAQAQKWLGRCPDCGAWNSMVEERPVPEAVAAGAVTKRYTLAASAEPQLYALSAADKTLYIIDPKTKQETGSVDQLGHLPLVVMTADG